MAGPLATELNKSTGDCGQPPTMPVGPMTSANCTLGGNRILWRGLTQYAPHPTNVPHNGARTIVDPGGSTFFLEGKPVAFIGDPIDCGDMVGEGASSSFSK